MKWFFYHWHYLSIHFSNLLYPVLSSKNIFFFRITLLGQLRIYFLTHYILQIWLRLTFPVSKPKEISCWTKIWVKQSVINAIWRPTYSQGRTLTKWPTALTSQSFRETFIGMSRACKGLIEKLNLSHPWILLILWLNTEQFIPPS